MNTLGICQEICLEPTSILEVGQTYPKKDLATLINEPRLSNVREGAFSYNNSNSYFLFVDLEKEDILDKQQQFFKGWADGISYSCDYAGQSATYNAHTIKEFL